MIQKGSRVKQNDQREGAMNLFEIKNDTVIYSFLDFESLAQ
jgi:hypothetical protein